MNLLDPDLGERIRKKQNKETKRTPHDLDLLYFTQLVEPEAECRNSCSNINGRAQPA